MGWFSDGSDVASQARAAAFLMSLTLPHSRLPALRILLTHARRAVMLAPADATPFERREEFRERGYHWDGRGRTWWILTETPQVEIAWLNAAIYDPPRDVVPIPTPATRRYSSRMFD